MEKEIIKTLTASGKVSTREKISLTSSLPIITKEESHFSKLLKTERLEELFEMLKKSSNKTVENVINGISRNDELFDEIIDSLERSYHQDVDIKKELIEILNRIITFVQKHNDEIVNKPTYNYLNKAKSDLMSDKDNKKTKQYITALNTCYIEREIHNLKTIIENALCIQNENNRINATVNMLKKAKSQDELNNILFYIMNLDENPNRTHKLIKFYRYNCDLVLSVMTKEVLKLYIDIQMSKITDEEKNLLENGLVSGKNLYDIFVELDEDYDKVKTDNGITELTLRIFHDELGKKILGKSSTLCFDCANGYTSRCEKIRDRKKKSIEQYPFIISGFQIIKNEEIEKFIITKCENFQKASKRNKLTAKELRLMKAKLAALFYGTETLGEGLSCKAKKKVMHI